MTKKVNGRARIYKGQSYSITWSLNNYAILPLKKIQNEREKKIFRELVQEVDIIKGFL